MVFPSQSTKPSVSYTINRAQSEAGSYKAFCDSSLKALQEGNVSSNLVINLNNSTLELISSLNTLITAEKAQEFADSIGLLNLVEQAEDLKSKAMGVIEAAKACLPMDEEGFLKNQKVEENGSLTTVPLAPSETVQLQTALSDVIAAIS